jgi:hypothetical protein
VAEALPGVSRLLLRAQQWLRRLESGVQASNNRCSHTKVPPGERVFSFDNIGINGRSSGIIQHIRCLVMKIFDKRLKIVDVTFECSNKSHVNFLCVAGRKTTKVLTLKKTRVLSS